jgi:hypothetical protein
VYNLQWMASDQLRTSTGKSSDEESTEAETAVASKSGKIGATNKSSADDPDTAEVTVTAGVGDFLNHLKTSGETRPSGGRYGGGAVEENTLDIDGDELEDMRVETEQVALTGLKVPPKIPRQGSSSETTAVGSQSRARTQDTSPLDDVDDDNENVGDITAVTDLNANANLDATDILSQRMDENPDAAVGQVTAKDKADQGKQNSPAEASRAKTVELGPDQGAAAVGASAGGSQEEMDPALKEAMASNPLATSRGKSLPQTSTQIVAPYFHDESESEESLAQMISLVSYRPPTKLAAIGSSIVLAAVAAFWVAGDGSTTAQASDEIAASENAMVEPPPEAQPATDPAAVAVAAVDTEEPVEGGVEAANEDAIEAARTAAREKAEAARLATLEAEALAEAEAEAEAVPVDTELTDPEEEENPEEPAEATELDEASEDPTAATDPEAEDETMEFDVEPAETPVEDVTPEPIEKPTKPTKPTPDRTPKLSKKQQRVAAKALYKKASVAFMQGNLAASEKGFKAALKADPSLSTSYRGLGLVYERRGSKKRAASALRRYLKNSPRAKDAAAIRARLDRLGK